MKVDLEDRTPDEHWGSGDAISPSENPCITSSKSYKLKGVLISRLSIEADIFLLDRD